MKNLFTKTTVSPEDQEDLALFVAQNRKAIESVAPSTQLLHTIMDTVTKPSVTDSSSVRTILSETQSERRTLFINTLITTLHHMKTSIKVITGTALAGALVLVLVFITTNKNAPLSPTPLTTNTVTDTSANTSANTTNNETFNTDTLVADLNAIDTKNNESVSDDSDLLTEIINTSNYEIQ